MPFSDLQKWVNEYPLLDEIIKLHPVTWINPNHKKMGEITSLPVNKHDLYDAATLWDRFAPYLAKAFPETKKTGGIIESELQEISGMKQMLDNYFSHSTKGRLFIKRDDALPVVGSIKARGGIFEVLHYAEELALESGMLDEDDNYEVLASDRFKSFFHQYTIGVGSTGNLGLSIGVISAQLGFKVDVYMSYDAKEWKKKLLREKGATVHEIEGDFSEAVNEGRRKTIGDPKGYFVDDENSKYLFLGYSVAALRLKRQLEKQKITVDEQHPLFIYSPCGIGGSPGGVAFGMKQVFGDCAHCFFVEPVHSPSVLIGLLTGKMEKVCVQDFGIDNRTEADGLAVGRPSAFASRISKLLISGIYTIDDDELFKLLFMLGKSENIFIEPSATPGLIGNYRIKRTNYIPLNNINHKNITHIAWATGGSLVPDEEMNAFYQKGRQLLAEGSVGVMV